MENNLKLAEIDTIPGDIPTTLADMQASLELASMEESKELSLIHI